MIGLDLRPCPGMHTSIPRRARHHILIPPWTAITQGETIGLPTAIQTLSAPTPAYRRFSGRSCQTACYNNLTLIRPQHRDVSYLYRSCQFMVSNRCPGCNDSDTGSSGMSAGRVCSSRTGKRCALSHTVLSEVNVVFVSLVYCRRAVVQGVTQSSGRFTISKYGTSKHSTCAFSAEHFCGV